MTRPAWTDERLDDLNSRVTEIKGEVGEVRAEIRDLRVEVRGELREIRGAIGALKRTMIQVGGGLIGTLVIGILGLVGTQL